MHALTVMASEYLAAPREAPDLHIPLSEVAVKVSCIDSTTRVKLPMGPFLQPGYTGKEFLTGPAFSFLVEHPSGKKVLFDLAVRHDWQSLPSYPQWRKLGWGIYVEKDVPAILSDHGVAVEDGAIDAIIWSHHHWDHTGDPSLFPSSTELVVGPGFKEAHMPPSNPKSTLMPTDYEGREVREIDFKSKPFKIGRFNAFDYFSDGSFYLLDTPGHTVGHICGFARTTTSPPTFVFMGGDASHHGGEFRPTEYLPIPKELTPSPMKRRVPICPGHLLEEIHPHKTSTKPFYYVTESFAYDKKVADWTIDGLGEFDCQDTVLLLTAHDDSIVDPAQIDFYPKALNEWYEKGTAKKVKWMFLKDFEGAVDAKENGGAAFVWAK
ncbi:hypothetical protein LTR95_014966 [Oleoguttula sp. CCFEE 5521]